MDSGRMRDLEVIAASLTLTASPLSSAVTEPPVPLVLGTVSVLVPRRWIFDIGIFSSRLTTWVWEESFLFKHLN